jgi:hypothetical protein
MTSVIFVKKKIGSEMRSDTKFDRRGECYADARKKKVPGLRSDLRPSEKELPERRSGAFRQKNTRGCRNISTPLLFINITQHLDTFRLLLMNLSIG